MNYTLGFGKTGNQVDLICFHFSASTIKRDTDTDSQEPGPGGDQQHGQLETGRDRSQAAGNHQTDGHHHGGPPEILQQHPRPGTSGRTGVRFVRSRRQNAAPAQQRHHCRQGGQSKQSLFKLQFK